MIEVLINESALYIRYEQWRIQHSVVTWAPGGPVLWV